MQHKNFIQRFFNPAGVTNTILLICVLVFVASQLLQNPLVATPNFLTLRGGKIATYMVLNGEWYRLVTALFLHADLMHLAMNGLTIYYIGHELEPVMGHLRFAILYLIAGIGGNLVSFAFMQPNVVSIGASGAGFGLFSCYLVLAYLYPNQSTLKQRAMTFGTLIVINALMSFTSPDIDSWAHGGGLLFGGLITYVLQLPQSRQRSWLQRLLAIILIAALAVGCYQLGLQRFYSFFRN